MNSALKGHAFRRAVWARESDAALAAEVRTLIAHPFFIRINSNLYP